MAGLESQFGRSLCDPDQGTDGLIPEHERLAASDAGTEYWKRWGPYLSDRHWGTVREDYSKDGNAWAYLPFDVSHQVAYRQGEDGIAGFSDADMRLCMSVAVWNGQDPILKERFFGLSGSEGNHAEDVKDLYYYLDATPTHSYLKMLYKYPQCCYPYEQLRRVSAQRGLKDPEYEILDTGIFDQDRYFDVFVEYARNGVDDILWRITAFNRGPQDAEIHVLPQAWFRNTWSWGGTGQQPRMMRAKPNRIDIAHPTLGPLHLYIDGAPEVMFCENDTNVSLQADEVHRAQSNDVASGRERSPRRQPSHRVAEQSLCTFPEMHSCANKSGPFKDGFNEYITKGNKGAVGFESGTKAGLYTKHTVASGGCVSIRVRLSNVKDDHPFDLFDATFESRLAEADQFYNVLQKDVVDPDRRLIQRQALAGMIWTKQYYLYDVRSWITGDSQHPKPPPAKRNSDWDHMYNADIISMPDKWEFPWYATWDLAFHCLPLALVDTAFAKQQLLLFTREQYMHPNGQLPAYEWNFSDVNPPVHAWAAWRVFQIDQNRHGGAGDRGWLEAVFHKLMLNFNWWVNRKDADGNNLFQGGFLGLDNIAVFSRSDVLPTGGKINQSDGTGWMAFYSLCLMRIALELALTNKAYESIASKFFEHFLIIARAMTRSTVSEMGLWDPHDEFYYDVLKTPDGVETPLKLRSWVGLIPLFAVETLEPDTLAQLPEFTKRMQWIFEHRPDLAALIPACNVSGHGERYLLSLAQGDRLTSILKRMLDPQEFLSEYGIRAVSRHHLAEPYVFRVGADDYKVQYDPAEASVSLMGGNSNWRGPIWFPMNYLLVESLQKHYQYHGDGFAVAFPTGSTLKKTLLQISEDLSNRLVKIFELREDGTRPAMNLHPKLCSKPYFQNNLLFHEYFHGDTGRGVGASHQTGWTGLVAKLIQLVGKNAGQGL